MEKPTYREFTVRILEWARSDRQALLEAYESCFQEGPEDEHKDIKTEVSAEIREIDRRLRKLSDI